MPATPEDFLSTMDDNMDGVSEGGSVAADMATLDNIDSTDDLVASLQVSFLFPSTYVFFLFLFISSPTLATSFKYYVMTTNDAISRWIFVKVLPLKFLYRR